MENKVAVVTGCNGGIGKGTCIEFVKNGWKVVGLDISEQSEPIEGVRFIQTDISKISEIERIYDNISQHEGKINALINNAAVQICKSFQDTTEEDWDSVMDVNMKAPYFLVSKLYTLIKSCRGAVVNVSSVHAVSTSKDISVYAASKGALLAVTRALAIECAADEVRVNAVLPGAVDTSMLRSGLTRGHLSGSSEEDLLRALGLKHIIGRVGQPQEIARSILFLADNNQSSFMTGQCITIDGGATIRLSTE